MKASNVTTEQFDAELIDLVDGMSGEQLLAIPGIYEILSEELNNDVLSALCAD
jgi:hypothetical protein